MRKTMCDTIRTNLLRGPHSTECASCHPDYRVPTPREGGTDRENGPKATCVRLGPLSAYSPSPGCASAPSSPRPSPLGLRLVGLGHVSTHSLFPAVGGRPLAGFRCGGSEMTESSASPEDPWVKASPEGAYADEGRAGWVCSRRGFGR